MSHTTVFTSDELAVLATLFDGPVRLRKFKDTCHLLDLFPVAFLNKGYVRVEEEGMPGPSPVERGCAEERELSDDGLVRISPTWDNVIREVWRIERVFSTGKDPLEHQRIVA